VTVTLMVNQKIWNK